MIFTYPEPKIARRHGPLGYSDYTSYKPWLRDEFAFRCAYCLKRETWGQVTAEFDLDHFVPQSVRDDLIVRYENLIYSCRRCNSVKGNHEIGDPFYLLTREHVTLRPDFTLQTIDSDVWRLIQILDLNSGRMLLWRMTRMRLIDLAKENDVDLFHLLAGPPSDLPNLRILKPPEGNSIPEGIEES